MPVTLTKAEQTTLEAAAAAEKGVRRWKRYQAVLLRAEGKTVAAVAGTLRCSQASVYAWTAAWRRNGVAGLREGDHGGGQVKLGAAGETLLEELLTSDPQARGHRATGWTVPLLRGELARPGVTVGERTIRRALHRLGYRWKRPRYILGRPDPAYAEKRGA
jgi:transposase